MTDFRRLMSLLRPYLGWMVAGILLSYVTLVANVTLMAVSGWFIASMALAGVAGISMNYFTPAAIIRAMAITRTVGRYAERLITHEATFRLLAHLRVWFYKRLEPLAPAHLQTYRSGDVLSRLHADIETLEHFYVRLLVPASVAVLGGLTFTVVLGVFSPTIAAIEAALLLVAGLIVPVLTQKAGWDAAQRQVAQAADLRAHMVEGLQGQAELAVYGALETHLQASDGLSAAIIEDQQRLSWLRGLANATVSGSAHLSLWATVIIAASLLSNGALAPAELAMLPMFVLASFEAVQPLPMAIQTWPTVIAATRRLFEVADRTPVVTEPSSPRPVPAVPDVRFEAVDFAYTPGGPTVLSGIDLDLSIGRKVAVVGPTGSGKSSLINLLLRFWPHTAGRISIGGETLDELATDDLRRLFSVVPQRIHLFNTTIRANLLMARQDADDAALRRVCRIVELDAFINDLPDGFDTFVGEAGTKLSGGQVRRLAIARALLKDAPILVLDEPGEGLDVAMEARVLAAVAQARGDRTLLIITHSLTGLDAMDEIAVMQDGRIVERGAPETLLTHGGVYRELHDLRRPLLVTGE